MAIDTQQKQRSMMNRSLPWRTQNLPVPDGSSISTIDRSQRLYRYAQEWGAAVASLGVIIKGVLIKPQISITTEIKEQINLTTSIE